MSGSGFPARLRSFLRWQSSRLEERRRGPSRAPQQPVTQPCIARSAGQHHGANGQNCSGSGVGIKLAASAPRQLADQGVQHVGIGEAGRKLGARDIAGERRQGAGLRVRSQIVPVEIAIEGRTDGRALLQLAEQAMAGPYDLGEQVVL